MKKYNSPKTLLSLFFVALTLIIVSCSSSEDDSCTRTCESGFELNEANCECEPIPCSLTCSTNETLNEDTCECEVNPEPFVANVIEVDASVVTLTGDWKKRTSIADYTGEGYIVWEGPGLTWTGNVGQVGQLEYMVNIPRAGTYLFKWRSYIAKTAAVDPWAEHNDSWLKMLDADDFFAKKNNSILYPSGSGQSPNPAGEGGNGFFKVYINEVDLWSNISSTSDNDAHEIFGTFNTAGDYTIIIAARSDFHAIDSFQLIEQEPE